MEEYSYADFSASIDDSGRRIADAIYNHISSYYPAYKPFDSRPKNKTRKEWMLNFRKKPKIGKPICNLYSENGKLSVQFVFLTSMTHEVLLRQDALNDRTRRFIFTHTLCKNCCGKGGCPWRQYFYIRNKMVMTCPYPYVLIKDAIKDDIKDLLFLIDLQAKHMTQDAKDIKGSSYGETNQRRCGNIDTVIFEQTDLEVDDFEMPDYCNPKRLEKYTAKYHITPMGVHDGLWFYFDEKAVCGAADSEYSRTMIPEGRYLSVGIADPLSFSVNRAWNYICKWAQLNDVLICSADLDGTSAPYFVKFYRLGSVEYMSLYVSIS